MTLDSYQCRADDEEAIVCFLLDLLCIFNDKNVTCVTIQSSIISILLNLFDRYHGCFTSPGSSIDLILRTFEEQFVRNAFVDTLQYAFNVRCILLNVDATAPAEAKRDSIITSDVLVNLSTSQVERPPEQEKRVYCINLKQKNTEFSQYRTRRHLLSRSHQQTRQPQSDEVDLNEPIARQLTAEERSYDWSVFVIHVLQFLEGVLYYVSELDGGDSIATMWMRDFKRPLLFSFSLYTFINQSKAKTRESDSICSMVRDLLEQYCRRGWRTE